MTSAALLEDLHRRGATVAVVGNRLRIEAPAGVISAELVAKLQAHKAELVAALTIRDRAVTFDPEAGELAAVKLVNTVIGDLWLVRDDDALAEHPDIIRSGVPVFFFDEVEALQGKTPEELREIAMIKTMSPTSRVLQ